MNTLKKEILIVTALFLSVMAYAVRPKDYSYISTWGSLGANSTIDRLDATKSIIGPSAALGVGYEWNRGHFLLNIGAEFSYSTSFVNMLDTRLTLDAIDTEGIPFKMNYQFTNWQQSTQTGYVNIPLRVGAKFNQFYFLVGAKLGLGVFGFGGVKSDLKTTGTYPNLIEDLENIPSHQFYSQTIKATPVSLQISPNIMSTVELGYILSDPKQVSKIEYRIGVFWDYGFSNISKNGAVADLITIPDPAMASATFAHYMQANETFSDFFNTSTVGVKFTANFSVGKKPCNCLPKFKPRKSYKTRRR